MTGTAGPTAWRTRASSSPSPSSGARRPWRRAGQVDGVVATFARRLDDLAGDALIGVGGDVGGRAGAGPDHGAHRVALRHDGVDEAAGGDVHLPQRQRNLAAHHGGKALAADEVVVAGLGRREGIGFVLESGNQDVHVGFPVVAFRRARGRVRGLERAVDQQQQGAGHQQGGDRVQTAGQRAGRFLDPADDGRAEEASQQADAVDQGDAAGGASPFRYCDGIAQNTV